MSVVQTGPAGLINLYYCDKRANHFFWFAFFFRAPPTWGRRQIVHISLNDEGLIKIYMETTLGVIILAAGLGKRMKSEKAKVLHEIDGKPMILHVIETASEIVGDDIIVVIGHQANEVKKTVSQSCSPIYVVQKEQLGTGHAVLTALPFIPDHVEKIVILYGDVPLLSVASLKELLSFHQKNQCDISTLAARVSDPKGYGRILFGKNGRVRKIVEEADATSKEKEIDLVNTGIYCVERRFLMDAAPKLKPENAQKEYYLTDIIEIAHTGNYMSQAFVTENIQETAGINSREELLAAEASLKKRRAEIS